VGIGNLDSEVDLSVNALIRADLAERLSAEDVLAGGDLDAQHARGQQRGCQNQQEYC
jgi:hypothetical protein